MGTTNVYKIELWGYTYYKPATTKAKAKESLATELSKRYKGRGYDKASLKRYMKITKVG